MVEALDDPYSVYLNPEEHKKLQERITGIYSGIGVMITLDAQKNLVVVTPLKGSPAHRAGLQSGDTIIKIDDQETKGMDTDLAARLLQGPPGTKVSLVIKRGGEEKSYSLTRQEVKIPSVEGKIIPEAPEIGYINITTFNEHTAGEFEQVLAEMKAEGFQGLVLDLRNNPGGELAATVEVASFFLPGKPVVYLVDRKRTSSYFAREGHALGVPLAVLVNEGTASAAEILAGALQDLKQGVIIGEKTFGKGLVQKVFPLREGGALKLTTAAYLTPAKKDINGQGIVPDFKVVLGPEETQQVLLNPPQLATDKQLQEAVVLLKVKLKGGAPN